MNYHLISLYSVEYVSCVLCYLVCVDSIRSYYMKRSMRKIFYIHEKLALEMTYEYLVTILKRVLSGNKETIITDK